ncbi:MAG: lipid-A-disaccharide synthase [Bacteroidetes bacterium]|nr:lipid-A-disaccharide synthase [Bacteroidota bacterium]
MSKYYLIAGESSGDIHGANLVKEIVKQDSQAIFRGFGGNQMKTSGVEIIQHFKDIAFMGFKEVALNLRTITKAIKLCKSDILKFAPDTIILIDYPGFNLRIAQFAQENNIQVMYYISPQIWAWKEKRIKKIKKYVNKMICILPFEKEFYAKYKFPVYYVGHPLIDHINSFSIDPDFNTKYNPKNQKLIAVLPGSRQQEIEKILPLIIEVCKKYADYKFLIAGSSNIDKQSYTKLDEIENASLIFDNSYNILKHADAGIIKSGTSTLEAALFKLPFVVIYKTTGITYRISKALIKIKYISLVNLILDKTVTKELIQSNLSINTLSKELDLLMSDVKYRQNMLADFTLLKQELGEMGASKRAAEVITSHMIK